MATSWRDHLPIHPTAELFPLMSESELRELGENIKANGLVSSIVLYKGKLLDGRNRLDAMEMVGIKFGFMRRTDPEINYFTCIAVTPTSPLLPARSLTISMATPTIMSSPPTCIGVTSLANRSAN
jgi:hypothetical protein